MSAEQPLPPDAEAPLPEAPPLTPAGPAAAPLDSTAPSDLAVRDRLGLVLLLVALALGGLGTQLFWGASAGLNLSLWAALGALSWLALARWQNGGRAPARARLLVPLLGFAGAFVWRDSPMLRTVDALLVLLAASLLLWRPASGSLRELTFTEARKGVQASIVAAGTGGFGLLFSDIRWKHWLSAGRARPLFRVLVGLALAVPLLAVFGGLFMAADANFEALARGLFHWNLETLIAQGAFAGALAWGAAGFLRQALKTPAAPNAEASLRAPGPHLGLIEVATVLVLLDALFATFVALQLPYLFGGAGHVSTTAGLTFADYARRGFFELSCVTALVLPLLLTLHWLLPTRAERDGHAFRLLAGAQLLLLGVIIASAAQRMAIYQAEYGLTLLRIYVLAFEAWMAGLLAWFAATVLRGRRERFVWGALVWGFCGAALMHLPNWEDRIVRSQAALAARGREVDTHYMIGLSADAMPALVATRQALPPTERSRVAHWLLENCRGLEPRDWRAWSLGRARALAAVQADRRALEADAALHEEQEYRE